MKFSATSFILFGKNNVTAGEIESIRKIDSKQAERELMEREKVIVEQAIRYFHGIKFFLELFKYEDFRRKIYVRHDDPNYKKLVEELAEKVSSTLFEVQHIFIA